MSFPRVAVIVLARSGSSRLPGKMLQALGEGTVLASALKRCQALQHADEIVLATTTSTADDGLAREALAMGIQVVRGSEQDVVARMQQAMDELPEPCDLVVRACADNPLFMPSVVDAALEELVDTGCDLVTPFEFATLPFGFGFVVMTRECLQRIDVEAQEAAYREHVENFCFEHPDRFHVRYQVADEALAFPELCLTLDYAVDLERLRRAALVLEGVPIEDQPARICDSLRDAQVWIEGQSVGDAEGHDLVLLASGQPELTAPRGVLVVDRFQVGADERYGLRYADPIPTGFPAGPVYLDEVVGGLDSPEQFLARVAELAVPHLLAAPARPVDLSEFAKPPTEKRVHESRRRGFHGPGEEAFPIQVILELAESSPQLLADLLNELEQHSETELYLPLNNPADLAQAIARLGAERVHLGCPPADPFRVLKISGPGEMEIRGARQPAGVGSLTAFWRSSAARAARAELLNLEPQG